MLLTYLKDGSLRIRCDVTVVREFRPDQATTAVRIPTAPSPDLSRDLGGLLAGGQVGGDVTFEVGGELFTAHRCVLAARSSVLAAELFGAPRNDGGGAASSRIRIDDMEPGVFKALLRFIYTDASPEMEDRSLLAAAERYDMERLKLICADMLCSYVDASTTATSLQLAKKHGCRRLEEACVRFLRDLLAGVDP